MSRKAIASRHSTTSAALPHLELLPALNLRALGDDAPTGAILGARVEHLIAKDALLADDPDVFFTTPHFDGYSAVLVRLDTITVADLEELIVEAWLVRAPKRIARDYVDHHLAPRRPD